MKKVIKKTILLLIITFSFSFSANAQETNNKETGKIYLMRSTGFALYNAPFKIFIDGELVCKLKNNKFSIHDLSEGFHECAVQFNGTKLKEKTEKFKVTIIKGKLTYVQVSIKVGFAISKVYCEEVTENTALQKIKMMEEEAKCL